MSELKKSVGLANPYPAGWDFDISSAKRQTGTNTDFTYHIPIPPVPDDWAFNTVCVTDAAIPKSWFSVVASHNTFVLTELGVSTTVTVPPGNYTAQQWTNTNSSVYIGALLTAASATLGHDWVYTATRQLQPDTGLIQYSVTGNNNNQPSFTINAQGDLYDQLGFPVNSTTTFSNNSLLGQIPFNTQGEFGVKLLSDVVHPNSNGSLASIYDCGLYPNGSVMKFQAQQMALQARQFQPSGSSNYFFKLISAENGLPIDTGGLVILIHLKFSHQESSVEIQRAILNALLRMEKRLLALERQQSSAAILPKTEAPPAEDPTAVFEPESELPAVEPEVFTEPALGSDPREGEGAPQDDFFDL